MAEGSEAEYLSTVLAIYCCAGLPKEKYIGKSLRIQPRRVAAAMDAERRVALSVPRPPPAPLVDSGWTLDGARPTPAPEF